jgi:DNA polymerase-3 subunit delta
VPRTASSRATEVLLLHGEERFLIDEAARATLESWKPELVSDFGFDTIEGTGVTPARLQDAILQAPFLDPFRAVHVRMLPAQRAEGVAGALADIPPTTRLLITVAGRLSLSNKLVKAVTAARGTATEMQHMKGRALSDWTTKRAVDNHGLTPAIAAQVVRVTTPDLSIIDSELSKLAAYKASGSKLTSDVITELLAGAREDEIFKLTDNLLPHPSPQAMQIARGLVRNGMQPTTIAYRMARHIALVLQVRARQDRGESLQTVQDNMAEHRFVIQKAYDVAKDSNPDHLETALETIRDYEFEVKSGQIDAELGLDVLLSRL